MVDLRKLDHTEWGPHRMGTDTNYANCAWCLSPCRPCMVSVPKCIGSVHADPITRICVGSVPKYAKYAKYEQAAGGAAAQRSERAVSIGAKPLRRRRSAESGNTSSSRTWSSQSKASPRMGTDTNYANCAWSLSPCRLNGDRHQLRKLCMESVPKCMGSVPKCMGSVPNYRLFTFRLASA